MRKNNECIMKGGDNMSAKEELKQKLSNEMEVFAKKADGIIKQCRTLFKSDDKENVAEIARLTEELDSVILEYKQKVKDNDMWEVGANDAGLNIYTILAKTYEQASGMLKLITSLNSAHIIG